MTHTDMNNIALKFASGVVFTVLNLQYYNWRWLRPLELIEVETSRGIWFLKSISGRRKRTS
jgi:hypothetical protein